jgi:hypothetical protein
MQETSTIIMPPTVAKDLKHDDNNRKNMPYVQMGLQLSNSNVALPTQNQNEGQMGNPVKAEDNQL